MRLENATLAVIIGITIVCLGFTIYILLKQRMSPVKKLFYFDISRYFIHIFILVPLLAPVLKIVSKQIFNPENLSLSPPGLATVQQWLIWWLGYPLLEFTQIDGILVADIYTVVLRRGPAPYLIVFSGLFFILALDCLWAYKSVKAARIIRTVHYGIWLFLFLLWTAVAVFISPDIPFAQDYRNKWLFMQYWGFQPWVVAIVMFGLFFSVWLPTIVVGYLIYKQYLHAKSTSPS